MCPERGRPPPRNNCIHLHLCMHPVSPARVTMMENNNLLLYKLLCKDKVGGIGRGLQLRQQGLISTLFAQTGQMLLGVDMYSNIYGILFFNGVGKQITGPQNILKLNTVLWMSVFMPTNAQLLGVCLCEMPVKVPVFFRDIVSTPLSLLSHCILIVYKPGVTSLWRLV